MFRIPEQERDFMKKLTLNKETVRNLDITDLKHVNGGGGAGRPVTLFDCNTKKACAETLYCTATCDLGCFTTENCG